MSSFPRFSRFWRKTAAKFVSPKKPPDRTKGPDSGFGLVEASVCIDVLGEGMVLDVVLGVGGRLIEVVSDILRLASEVCLVIGAAR